MIRSDTLLELTECSFQLVGDLLMVLCELKVCEGCN